MSSTAHPALSPAAAPKAQAQAGTTILPLHGLRGLAAITVMFGHILHFRSAPAVGVVLFFIISGFLMGKLYLGQPFTPTAVTRYGFARIGRVYPLFAAVVASAVLFHFAGLSPPFDMTPENVARHLALAGDGGTIWTISVEFQFYGLFIALWWLASRAEARGLSSWWWLIPAFAVTTIMAIVVREEAGRIALWRYLHLFLVGLVLALALRKEPSARMQALARAGLPLGLAAYWLIFLFAGLVYNSDRIYGDPVAVSACIALVWCTLAVRDGPVMAALSSRPFLWLGEVSFGIYLLHRVVEAFFAAAMPGASELARFMPTAAGTLLLAGVAHRLIEGPARLAMRGAGERVVRQIERAR